MRSVSGNRHAWSGYDSYQRSERWSPAWGDSESIWFGTLLPRLHRHLPAPRVLEIAPGFGRFTRFLLEWCDELVAVDVAERCIAHCRTRFAEHTNAHFFVTDTFTLDMIEDRSLDFVFSWATLVHAEYDVIEGYVRALGRKMKPGGAGFIHHSNLGAYVQSNGFLTVANPHWRARSMTADLFRHFCHHSSLRCVVQELVSWGQDDVLNDCFSFFVHDGAEDARNTSIVERPDYMRREVERLRELRALYTP